MYIISGCPRSGTSLCMDLMRVAYGEDRIIGKKFPQQERMDTTKQGKNESDHHYAIRQYIISKSKKQNKENDFLEDTIDMNPNGFWEMLYTCKGVRYRFSDTERLEKILNEDKKSFCKIVSQGLAQSDPKYIDKIIYMIRDPRSVAKSHEKLKGQFGGLPAPLVNGESAKKHSPEMFINVTVMASQWLLKYPDVPVHYVFYDKLLEDPIGVLKGIQEFLGEEGNIEEASKCIDMNLKRSFPQDVPCELWEDAEFIYNKFIDKKYDEIVEYIKNPDIKTNRSKVQFKCLRSDTVTFISICEMCRTNNSNYVKNKIKQSDNDDWKTEPCLYECLYNKGYKLLTIEESVKNNFWVTGEPLNIPKDQEIISTDTIEYPVIKEFDNITDMQKFLDILKEKGKPIKNAIPSPNGKGGYILVVL